MTRFIAATLTLALITGMSSGKASASNVNNTMHQNFYPNVVDPDDCPEITCPADDFILWEASPQLGGQEGAVTAAEAEDIMDLWFELVDAGYTEDEAFEMIEMLMGEDGRSIGGGYKLSRWVYDEYYEEMYWVE